MKYLIVFILIVLQAVVSCSSHKQLSDSSANSGNQTNITSPAPERSVDKALRNPSDAKKMNTEPNPQKYVRPNLEK